MPTKRNIGFCCSKRPFLKPCLAYEILVFQFKIFWLENRNLMQSIWALGNSNSLYFPMNTSLKILNSTNGSMMLSSPLVKAESGKLIRYIVPIVRYRMPNGFALRMSKPTVKAVLAICTDLKRRASTFVRLLPPTTVLEGAKKGCIITNPSLTIVSSVSNWNVFTALLMVSIKGATEKGIKQCWAVSLRRCSMIHWGIRSAKRRIR